MRYPIENTKLFQNVKLFEAGDIPLRLGSILMVVVEFADVVLGVKLKP